MIVFTDFEDVCPRRLYRTGEVSRLLCGYHGQIFLVVWGVSKSTDGLALIFLTLFCKMKGCRETMDMFRGRSVAKGEHLRFINLLDPELFF